MSTKTHFRIAAGLHEGVHYTVVKDGHGVEYPVAIASHETFMPRKSGIVHIEAVRISINESRSAEQGRRDDIETRSIFRNVKDAATGLYFGIAVGINETDKTVKWLPIKLSPRQPYDLSKTKDREEWAMISRMSNLEGSPNQKGRALYKIIDHDVKALSFINILEKRHDAANIVKGLDLPTRREMALNVGINADAYSPDMLYAELIMFADKNAEKFLSTWNNPRRPVISIFNRALKYGIIENNQRGDGSGNHIGYYYNRIFLGDNEGAVVSKLAEAGNTQMLSSISVAAKQRESEVLAGLSHSVEVKEEKLSTPVIDAEKEELKRQLAELQARLGVGAVATPQVNNTAPVSNTEPLTTSTSNALDLLRAEAKELKIPRWHILGEDKLRAAIAEKKTQVS